MSVRILESTTICYGGLFVSDQANKVELERTIETRDATTFTSGGWRAHKAAFQSAAAKASGFVSFDAYETGALVFDKELFDRLGDSGNTPLTVAETSADGSIAYVMAVTGSRFKPLGNPVGDLAPFEADWKSKRKGLGRGAVLHPVGTTRNSSGTGTGQIIGAASSSQRIVAALHVISATGTTPSLTVVVESDDNGGFATPTTRFTFGAKTAAGSEYMELAGAITDDRYRIGWTISGGTPVFRFVVAVGII